MLESESSSEGKKGRKEGESAFKKKKQKKKTGADEGEKRKEEKRKREKNSLLPRINILTRLPNHHNIILRRRRHRPRQRRTPTDIPGLASMPSMHEQQLWRSIIRIVRRLFFSDLGDVPDVYSSIGGGGSKDCFRVRGPGELDDFVCVGFEGVEFGGEFSEIPEGDGLVRKEGEGELVRERERERGEWKRWGWKWRE